MGTFLDVALATADVDRACDAAGVGMGDYLRGRRKDLAFDLECQELDLILKLAVRQSVTAAAAKGDRQAARMVARGELEMREALADVADLGASGLASLLQVPTVDPAGLSDFVVEAVRRAYHEAGRRERDCRRMKLPPPVDPPESGGWICPHCGRPDKAADAAGLAYCMAEARKAWERGSAKGGA